MNVFMLSILSAIIFIMKVSILQFLWNTLIVKLLPKQNIPNISFVETMLLFFFVSFLFVSQNQCCNLYYTDKQKLKQ